MTHENKCLKKEIEIHKALIEDLKEEAKRRIQDHESVIAKSQ